MIYIEHPKLGLFTFDAAIDENHNFSSEVTDDPVEEGSNVTDHKKLNPNRITITGLVSDTPIGDELINIRQNSGNASPSVQALEFLLAINESKEPVKVFTTLRPYSSMVLENLSIPKNAETGKSLQFTANFKEIKFVSNNKTTVRVKLPRSKKKANRGHKPPKKEKKKLVGVKITRVIDISRP